MQTRKQIGLDLLLEVWGQNRFELLPDLCHPDVVRKHKRMPAKGYAEYEQVVRFYKTAFPDLRYSITRVVEEGDTVAILYDVSGTMSGPLGNIPPSHESDTLTCIDVYLFRDDRISEIHTAFDELGVMLKAGAVKWVQP